MKRGHHESLSTLDVSRLNPQTTQISIRDLKRHNNTFHIQRSPPNLHNSSSTVFQLPPHLSKALSIVNPGHLQKEVGECINTSIQSIDQLKRSYTHISGERRKYKDIAEWLRNTLSQFGKSFTASETPKQKTMEQLHSIYSSAIFEMIKELKTESLQKACLLKISWESLTSFYNSLVKDFGQQISQQRESINKQNRHEREQYDKHISEYKTMLEKAAAQLYKKQRYFYEVVRDNRVLRRRTSKLTDRLKYQLESNSYLKEENIAFYKENEKLKMVLDAEVKEDSYKGLLNKFQTIEKQFKASKNKITRVNINSQLKENDIRQKLGIEKQVAEIMRKVDANDLLDLQIVSSPTSDQPARLYHSISVQTTPSVQSIGINTFMSVAKRAVMTQYNYNKRLASSRQIDELIQPTSQILSNSILRSYKNKNRELILRKVTLLQNQLPSQNLVQRRKTMKGDQFSVIRATLEELKQLNEMCDDQHNVENLAPTPGLSEGTDSQSQAKYTLPQLPVKERPRHSKRVSTIVGQLRNPSKFSGVDQARPSLKPTSVPNPIPGRTKSKISFVELQGQRSEQLQQSNLGDVEESKQQDTAQGYLDTQGMEADNESSESLEHQVQDRNMYVPVPSQRNKSRKSVQAKQTSKHHRTQSRIRGVPQIQNLKTQTPARKANNQPVLLDASKVSHELDTGNNQSGSNKSKGLPNTGGLTVKNPQTAYLNTQPNSQQSGKIVRVNQKSLHSSSSSKLKPVEELGNSKASMKRRQYQNIQTQIRRVSELQQYSPRNKFILQERLVGESCETLLSPPKESFHCRAQPAPRQKSRQPLSQTSLLKILKKVNSQVIVHKAKLLKQDICFQELISQNLSHLYGLKMLTLEVTQKLRSSLTKYKGTNLSMLVFKKLLLGGSGSPTPLEYKRHVCRIYILILQFWANYSFLEDFNSLIQDFLKDMLSKFFVPNRVRSIMEFIDLVEIDNQYKLFTVLEHIISTESQNLTFMNTMYNLQSVRDYKNGVTARETIELIGFVQPNSHLLMTQVLQMFKHVDRNSGILPFFKLVLHLKRLGWNDVINFEQTVGNLFAQRFPAYANTQDLGEQLQRIQKVIPGSRYLQVLKSMQTRTVLQSQVLLYQLVKLQYSNLLLDSCVKEVLGQDISIIDSCMMEKAEAPLLQLMAMSQENS